MEGRASSAQNLNPSTCQPSGECPSSWAATTLHTSGFTGSAGCFPPPAPVKSWTNAPPPGIGYFSDPLSKTDARSCRDLLIEHTERQDFSMPSKPRKTDRSASKPKPSARRVRKTDGWNQRYLECEH